MYTFVRALAVEPGTNKRWNQVDISKTQTSTLFTTYRQIYAVLTHPLVQEKMTLDLATIAEELQVFSGTISDYLSSIGGKTLETVLGEPAIIRNNAVFSDAYQAGYDVQSIDYTVGEGVEVPEDRKDHLAVYVPNDPDDYDYLTFRKKVVANVNGFYHRSAADSRGYYIVDGNKTRRKSNQGTVGLLSFATFGEIDIEEITEDHLDFEVNPATNLVEMIYLKFNEADLVGKTPILFLGGYMVMVDSDTLFLVNDDVLAFKTLKYPFHERYFESMKHLDFTGFDPIHTADNPTYVSIDALKSEAFLRKYFTMNQSFLILVDTKNLVLGKSYPEVQTVPHTFLSWEEPKWPLVVGEGKHEVYWKQYEAGCWILRCVDTYRRNYIFQTTSTGSIVALDDQLYLGNAGHSGDGYMLKLIDEEIKILTT